MQIEQQKLKLIQQVLQLRDLDLVNRLLLLSQSEEEWWDSLSESEQASIERGIAEAESGELVSHEEVMEKYKKWL